MANEFLPFCDVIFNVVSLISYFCDVVFDVITVYTLYEKKQWIWFSIATTCVILSLVISQILSICWYIRSLRISGKKPDATFALVGLLHFLQAGVLLRHFKLLVPVEPHSVKHEVRDLCMLRMTHAFCEAGPMLLLQLYLIWNLPSPSYLNDLKIVSTALSLFSVCWALASFNKNIRRRNIHKLVLTWLGVIFQFLWHLGTVSSRVVALTVYATLYRYWVFLVIGLHWISMFLWLMSPKNVFHGERISCVKKVFFSFLIAYVYVFCYANLQEVNSCQKIAAFYTTMFLENTLLIAVWLGQSELPVWYHYPVIVVVFGAFAFGILFMILYYRFFHLKRLKTLLDDNPMIVKSCTNCQLGTCREHTARSAFTYIVDNAILSIDEKLPFGEKYVNGPLINNKSQYTNNIPPNGVFNCRLNPALKRKKKKPTTFVPPPSVPVITPNTKHIVSLDGSKDRMAFWKQPLPISFYPSLKSSYHHHGSSDLDASSVGSRVNIQQKLQEKRKQQLQELQEIQEEIKQGKLHRPYPAEISEQGTLRQPIPRSKKQPWLRNQPTKNSVKQENYSYGYMTPNIDSPSRIVKHIGFGRGKNQQRAKTPEVLLSPHYLDNSRIYHHDDCQHWKEADLISEAMNNMPNYIQNKLRNHYIQPSQVATEPDGGDNREDWRSQSKCNEIYKSCRVPSDLDSQISLPRSYTLPREFKYYHQHRHKPRKIIKSDHFMTSNNSSDGDVDSADENDHRCMWSPTPVSSYQCYSNYTHNTPYVLSRNTSKGQHETQL